MPPHFQRIGAEPINGSETAGYLKDSLKKIPVFT